MKVVHGGLETGLAAEGADELQRRPEPVDRRNPEYVGVVQIEHAFVGVLVEQRGEYGTGLLPVLREHVALADVLGTLAAGQWLGVEGDMADQVEGIELPA